MASSLVTGAAGFIGFHLARAFLQQGRPVIGIDNLNEYYDINLKRARLERLEAMPGFNFVRIDLADAAAIADLFTNPRVKNVTSLSPTPSVPLSFVRLLCYVFDPRVSNAYKFATVINLAAQAGVRYSLVNLQAYVKSNIEGFVNILEASRQHQVAHLLYASSSSVYGSVTKMPFSVHQNVDHPVSTYAATKKANELLAHSYSHLFGLPTTGMRFFTVYGPWGRPDMALFLFTRAILAGEPIKVFNNGNMLRDFTYIDDVVEAVGRLAGKAPEPDQHWSGEHPDPATSCAPYHIYNIGNHRPVKLLRVIEILEECLGRKAHMQMLPMQPGDVPATYADIDDLARDISFWPSTSIEIGIELFVRWYRDFFKD